MQKTCNIITLKIRRNYKLQENLASARKASTVDEVQRLLEDLREQIETFEKCNLRQKQPKTSPHQYSGLV